MGLRPWGPGAGEKRQRHRGLAGGALTPSPPHANVCGRLPTPNVPVWGRVSGGAGGRRDKLYGDRCSRRDWQRTAPVWRYSCAAGTARSRIGCARRDLDVIRLLRGDFGASYVWDAHKYRFDEAVSFNMERSSLRRYEEFLLEAASRVVRRCARVPRALLVHRPELSTSRVAQARVSPRPCPSYWR